MINETLTTRYRIEPAKNFLACKTLYLINNTSRGEIKQLLTMINIIWKLNPNNVQHARIARKILINSINNN